MALDDLISSIKPKMAEAQEHLIAEFQGVHAGRADASLVASVMVSYYGTKTPLQQLASINTPSANQIVITPYDKNSLGDIEEAIRNSQVKINPVNDGRQVRLVLPPLTEERREELVKLIKTKVEEAKISIRNMRREVWDEIQTQAKKNELSEDEKYRGEELLNRMTEDHNKKIDELAEKKEKELMTV